MSGGTGRIGRFRLVDVSGTGTFATVHRATDERLGDTVAIKVLAENHSLDADVRERFVREGRALRRVDSPHVVAVHDLGETDRQQPYLVMQHADRGTLDERVAAHRRAGWRVDAGDVLAVARPLAAAVEAVHRADLVHRDLSPRNVLLRSLPGGTSPAEDATVAEDATPTGHGTRLLAADEALLLADLGLCKDLALHSGLTAAGGTHGFRPPEQHGSASYITSAADVWALSALLTWLVVGEVPEADQRLGDAVAAVGLPARLGHVLTRSLATDPAARADGAAAWLAEVEDALRATATATPAEGAVPAIPTAPARPGRARLAAGTAVGIVVTALVLAAVVRDDTTTTALADGAVLVERAAGDATVGLAGPTEVAVGEQATFLAQVEGVTSLVWFAPDGAALVDRPTLTFATTSPGTAVIHLVARTGDGDVVRVEHHLRVRSADDAGSAQPDATRPTT